ncbi:MAG: TolC family protein, partial [Nitrospirales bacterium]|nr:TolC family protein [Nitrospirales bacterium]
MINQQTRNQSQRGPHEQWTPPSLMQMGLVFILLVLMSSIGEALAAETPVKTRQNQPPPAKLQLSLNDALALFLKKNMDLLVVKYGIDAAKGRQITAGLFPNPTFSVNTLTSYTQKCTLERCGGIMPVLTQLFEVAGKRGFRVESAGYGTKSSEAMFEDTVRKLRFAVKDAYYRIQVGREHLKVDKKMFDRISLVLKGKFMPNMHELDNRERIRFRIEAVQAQAQVIHDIQDIDAATADLRVLLGLNPLTELKLTTPLEYHRVDPHQPHLLKLAENRPDIVAKRLIFSKRKAEFRLAKSIAIPDVTVDLGYLVQGPMGPDNQQQWTFNVGIPLPIFDQNQGGIMVANADLLAAQADLQKTYNDLYVEVDTAYRRMVQSRNLVEAYRVGILEESESLVRSMREAYAKEDVSFLDMLDAGRTNANLQED